ncbi:MAG: TOBE domain-containing protein, partial [Anaerolineae bacterium]|nr:TOBE domain-containing protein [Anaerolineae bacterium]
FEGEVVDHHWQGRNFGGYPIRSDLPDGTRVVLGVRPEFIQPSDEGLPAYVQSVTPHFAERHHQIEVAANGEHWLMLLPMEVQVTVGDVIHCAPDPDALQYFDRETHARIG